MVDAPDPYSTVTHTPSPIAPYVPAEDTLKAGAVRYLKANNNCT